MRGGACEHGAPTPTTRTTLGGARQTTGWAILVLKPDAPVPSNVKIFVAEGTNFVGSALARGFRALGFGNIAVGAACDLDLREKDQVNTFFEAELPDVVFLISTRLDGPATNAASPAQWLHDSLLGMSNVVHASYLYEVRKLVCVDCNSTFLDLAAPPPDAGHAWAEVLEETQRACLAASHATTELCDSYRRQYACDFLTAVTAGLYGPGLNFGSAVASVVPALVRDVLHAKMAGLPDVLLPGSEAWRRELLYLDDVAQACVFLAEHVSEAGAIHIGSGRDFTLPDLAGAVGTALDYDGRFHLDERMPPSAAHGAFRADTLGRHGWRPTVSLAEGIERTCRWYLQRQLAYE